MTLTRITFHGLPHRHHPAAIDAARAFFPHIVCTFKARYPLDSTLITVEGDMDKHYSDYFVARILWDIGVDKFREK